MADSNKCKRKRRMQEQLLLLSPFINKQVYNKRNIWSWGNLQNQRWYWALDSLFPLVARLQITFSVGRMST